MNEPPKPRAPEPSKPRVRHAVPDLLVEKLHLGELPPDEAAKVRARLEAHGELGRLDALRDSDRELASRLPPPPRPAPLARLAETRPPRRWLAPTLAVAATALFFAVATPLWLAPRDPHPLPDEVTRAKGGAELLVHRLGPRGPELMNHGQEAREGDRLQLTARLPTPAYLAIVSVDGLGVVTVHQPPTETPVREVVVPSSFVLDDAPHHERFFLFSSAAPMAAERLVTAVRLSARPTNPTALVPPEGLPEGVVVHELRLDKASPR